MPEGEKLIDVNSLIEDEVDVNSLIEEPEKKNSQNTGTPSKTGTTPISPSKLGSKYVAKEGATTKGTNYKPAPAEKVFAEELTQAAPLDIDPAVDQKLKEESAKVEDAQVTTEVKIPEPATAFAEAMRRGYLQGEQADILTIATERGDIDVNRLAEIQSEMERLKGSDEYQKFQNSQTFSEALSALADNPVGIISELTAESLAAFLNHGLTRVGAGVITGGAAGSAVPGIGTAFGAGAGAIAGVGLASLNLEYSSDILSAMQEAGINIRDPKSIERGFSDDFLYERVRDEALKKGVPIALFDMISAGIAGRIASKPAKTLLKKAGQLAAETGAQSALGAGGEVAGELISGEKLNPAAILAEAIGEIGGGAPEIAIGTITHKAKSGREISDQEFLDAAVSQRQGVDINETLDLYVSSGQLTQEQAQAISDNITKYNEVISKVPDQFTPEQTKKAAELLIERQNIEAQMQGKDEALVAPLQVRIEEINNELKSIANDTGAGNKTSDAGVADTQGAGVNDNKTTETINPNVDELTTDNQRIEETGAGIDSGDTGIETTTGPQATDIVVADTGADEVRSAGQEEPGYTALVELVKSKEKPTNMLGKAVFEAVLSEDPAMIEEAVKTIREQVVDNPERATAAIGEDIVNLVNQIENGKIETQRGEDGRQERLLTPQEDTGVAENVTPVVEKSGEKGEVAGMDTFIGPLQLAHIQLSRKERERFNETGELPPYWVNKADLPSLAKSLNVSKEDLYNKIKKEIDQIDFNERWAQQSSTEYIYDEEGDIVDEIEHKPAYRVKVWALDSQGDWDISGKYYTEDAARKDFDSNDDRQEGYEDRENIVTIDKYDPDSKEWEEIDSKENAPINEETEELLYDVQRHFGGKYTDIRLPNGKTLNLRISDHSANRRNNTGDRNLSIVISNLNPTERFKNSDKGHSNELEFDSSYTAEEIIASIDEAIMEIKEYEQPTIWSEKYSISKWRDKYEISDRETDEYIDKEFDTKDQAESYAKTIFEGNEEKAIPEAENNNPPAGAEVGVEYGQVDTDTEKTELTPEEKTNLEKVGEEVGENFRKVQNAINKYSPGKDLSRVTAEDYREAIDQSENEPGRKKRRLTQQILKDPTLSNEFKSSIGEDEIYYDVLPNKVTLSEANAIIDYLGTDGASREIENFNNAMTLPVRNTVAQVLIKRLEKEDNYEQAAEVRERLVKSATEQGQGVQALAMFPALSPEGEVRKVQREINKMREDKEKGNKKLKNLKKGIREINKEAAKEAAKKVKVKLEQANKIEPTPKEKRNYGTKNKIVTKDRYKEALKAVKGKFFSNIPPELVEIAAYHVEASGREFVEYAKNMTQDLGKKVKPYLRELYKKAKNTLIGEVYTESDFLNDEEVETAAAEFYSEGLPDEAKKLVKEGLKDMGVSLEDIVTKHYTVFDAAKRTLTEKLVQDAGLAPQEATLLAQAIQSEFDKIAGEKKKKLINDILSPKEKKTRQAKMFEDELLKLTNLGAFRDEDVTKKYADLKGWPKLTPVHIKEIEKLAEKVESYPEGFKKFRAVENLLTYEAKIPGTDWRDIATSIWYANILSGPNTQLINFVSNFTNTVSLYINAAAQNPQASKFLAHGIVAGIREGLVEAQATMKTGTSPIRDKVEAGASLERTKFWGKYNPANLYKYVRRVMVAADVLFFEAQKEMRAYQMAWKLAAENDQLEPSQSQKERALEILNLNDDTIEKAKFQANEELEAEIEALKKQNLPADKEKIREKQLNFDAKRRFYELLEKERGEEIIRESNYFAARGTYNYKPEGALGALANSINQATTRVKALRFVVPFTNIIANVANEAINYTPAGFARAATNKGSLTGNRKQNLSEQERVDLTTKAIMGTTLMIAAYVLSQPGDEDEIAKEMYGKEFESLNEEQKQKVRDKARPYMEITANGTGDYRKNYNLQPTGWQPYSVRIGDKWYSYQYTPFLLGLALIGNIRDFEKYREEKITDNGFLTKIGAAMGYTARTLFDMTFLTSLNNFLSAAMDPRNENRIEDALRSTGDVAKGFVLPNAYSQSAKEIENFFEIPTKEVRGTMFGSLLRDIPVARDQYFDKINVLGDPVIPDTDKIVSSVENDKYFDLIAEKRMWPSIPSIKVLTIVDTETDKERPVTLEEYYNFSKIRGSFIKERLEEDFDDIKEMTPEEAKKWMRKVQKDATKEAKSQLTE